MPYLNVNNTPLADNRYKGNTSISEKHVTLFPSTYATEHIQLFGNEY